MDAEKILGLKTFHGTKVYYDQTRGVYHAEESDASRLQIELTDEAAKIFMPLDDRKIYFALDGGKFVAKDEAVELKYIRNYDGTISILEGEKYLSALEGSSKFGLMPHNITWEHFTLEPIEEPKPELFRLRTFHKTQMLYSSARSFHHAAQPDGNSQPIKAQIQDNRLIISAGDGENKKFFSIDAKGKIVVSNKISPVNFIRNKDGTISIIHGKSFLSARKGTGLFDLRPKNLGWEHFTFELASDLEHRGGGGRPPVDSVRCAGCTACAMVCPRGAITMQEDAEGFQAPTFDRSLCVDCGLCEKVCPILHPNRNPAPAVSYAAWIADDAGRARSSSGGLAYALSKTIIEQGGVVCGAAIENFVVKHIIVDNVDDLIKLQGTKYVQSDLGNNFVEIKKLLSDGRKVLFVGTPCQVAGLKNFLQGHDENLRTVDLVCHGVPSPGVLRRYIAELRRRYPTAATMSFRDKVWGWHPMHAFALYDKNSKTVFREGGPTNVYITGFLRNVFCRQSCGQCPFATKTRVGDITLSDYWGIATIDSKLNDKKGTSLVLLNTPHGKELFSAIKEKLRLIREVPYSFAVSHQGQLRHPGTQSPLRPRFFQWMRDGKSVEYFLERSLFPVGLLNFHFANSFGALLVSYALQRAVEFLGYPAQNINYNIARRPITAYSNFRSKFIKASKTPLNSATLQNAGRNWKRVIVGSDQVWKMFNTEVFMLGWASGRKNLISYAASFGQAHYAGRISVERAKKLLGRFDFISVREDSGVNICKDVFNVEANHVIDPTMLMTREHYEALINPKLVVKPDKPYVVVAYINTPTSKIIADNNLLKDFREKYVLWNSLADEKGERRSMSTWLASIRDAEYVITDSFHVTVFSILFNKQFVSVVRANGLARIPSLLRQCGIPSTRIYKSTAGINLKSFETPIDYEKVNLCVAKEREKGFMFLKMALAAPLNWKDPV